MERGKIVESWYYNNGFRRGFILICTDEMAPFAVN